MKKLLGQSKEMTPKGGERLTYSVRETNRDVLCYIVVEGSDAWCPEGAWRSKDLAIRVRCRRTCCLTPDRRIGDDSSDHAGQSNQRSTCIHAGGLRVANELQEML